jgi:RHS repeat-associated protein
MSACPGSEPASQNAADNPSLGVGNPINVVSGNKYQRETDMPALPGELGIEVVRHYNSMSTADSGHLGRGWRLSYETEIRKTGDRIELIQADGKQYLFFCKALICKTAHWADGIVLIDNKTDTNVRYRWRWLAGDDAGRELAFDSRGLLLSIKAISGNELTIARSEDGRIREVIDPQGRRLFFGYPSAAELKSRPTRFDGVAMISTPIGSLRYEHGSAVPIGVGSESNHAYLLRQSNLVSAQFVGEPSALHEYFYESVYEGQHSFLTGIALNGVRQSTYLYDKQGLGVLSTRGEPARLAKDEHGKVLEPARLEEGTGVEQVALLRKKQGEVMLVNSLGVETRYSFSIIAGQKKLVEVLGPGCSTCGQSNRRYEYSKTGLLVKEMVLDNAGSTVSTLQLVRDPLGRVVEILRDGQRETGFSYGPDQRLTGYDVQIPSLEPTEISYASRVSRKTVVQKTERNSRGQIIAHEISGWSPPVPESSLGAQPISHRETYEFELIAGRSLIRSSHGAEGKVEFSWDNEGRFLKAMMLADSSMRYFEQDKAGREALSKTVIGNRVLQRATQYRLNMISQTTMTAWFVDALNQQLIPISLISENPRKFLYDANARLVEVIDKVGRSRRFSYDRLGRFKTDEDARRYGAAIDLDTESRVIRSAAIFKGETVRASYAWFNDDGQMAQRLRSDGRIDRWHYDAIGRPSHKFDNEGIAQQWLRHKRHVGGSLKVSLSSDGEVDLSYSKAVQLKDDLGRVIYWASPDHGPMWFRYDAAGRVADKRRSDGVTEKFLYDVTGRLVQHSWLDIAGVKLDESRYEWQDGLIKRMGNAHQRTIFERDAFGRVALEKIELVDLESPKVFTTSSEYDGKTGQLLQRVLFDGRVLKPQFANVQFGGHAQTLSLHPAWTVKLTKLLGEAGASALVKYLMPGFPLVSDIRVDPLNGLASYRFGNGLAVNRNFDLAGRLIHIEQPRLGSMRISYGVGPKIKASQQVDANGVSLQKLDYTYRGVGKLDLSRIDDVSELTQHRRHHYFFNVNGQLKEVVDMATKQKISQYRYNAKRQRVSKTVFEKNGITKDGERSERFFLWQDNQIAAEVMPDGSIAKQYVYLNDGAKAIPVALLSSENSREQVQFVHADYRGAPVAMSDEHQRIVWRTTLSPSGVAINKSALDGVTLNLRLPGQYFDAETGLHDNFHRTYDPASGRYLQPDPLGYPNGPDAFVYAGGDPINKTDSKGLYEEDVHYYLTYYLALTAGLTERQSWVIATANRYIDDNTYTEPFGPIWLNYAARRYYHFTQSMVDDPTPQRGEATVIPGVSMSNGAGLEEYVNANIQYSQPYIDRRILNPTNPQLTRLRSYAMNAINRCQQAQFYGEYLHAYEDTFAHRDPSNTSYSPEFGHLGGRHSPDLTYNTPGWTVNARRTYEMEAAVFRSLRRDFGRSAVDIETSRPIEFARLSETLIRFNADRTQTGEGDTFSPTSSKIEILNRSLFDLGLDQMRPYSALAGENCRNTYLRDRNGNFLEQANFPGTILATPGDGTQNMTQCM